MCDWPKSDCDVSVTDRQTDKHFGFWAITFESPPHQGARGLRPRAPWCSGNYMQASETHTKSAPSKFFLSSASVRLL